MVEFDDIDEVSFQVKKEFVVSIYCFEGENLASFLVKAFFDIPVSAFAYLFSYCKFSFKVFGIDRFWVEPDVRIIEFLRISLREFNILLGAFLLGNEGVDPVSGRVENRKDFEFGSDGGESVISNRVIFIVGLHFL